jgi:hypothetical protein
MLMKLISGIAIMGIIGGCASETEKDKTGASMSKTDIPSSYLKLLDKKETPSTTSNIYYCAERTGEGIPEGLDILCLISNDKSRQSWERAFAFLWHDQRNLWLCAVMEDSDVYNNASGKHSDPHAKGDVVELFFQPSGDAYRELHLAPNLATSELAWPNTGAFRKRPWPGGIRSFDYDSGMKGKTGTFNLPSGVSGWWALMQIPLEKLGTSPDKLGSARFAVCRYNRNTAWGKKKPELSSIANFDGGSFHRPDKWLEIKVK